MPSDNFQKCSAPTCDSTAVNHVKFRFGDPESPVPEYVQKNYCEKHIKLVSSRFPVVILEPLSVREGREESYAA